MNFLEMLLMSKKMAFVDGAVTLYGQNVLIFPAPSMVHYINLSKVDLEQVKDIYSMAKSAMLEQKQEFINVYKPNEGMNWVTNVINLYGLGKISFEKSSNPSSYTIFLDNSPFIDSKDEIKAPVDHILRGIIAGVTSAVLGKDFDVIEIECVGNMDKRCKFILDSKENLMKDHATIFKSQI